MNSTTTESTLLRLVATHSGIVVGAWTARSAFPVDIVLLYAEWEENGQTFFAPAFYFHARPVPVFAASLLEECQQHRDFCDSSGAADSKGKLPRPQAAIVGWRSLDVGRSSGAVDGWTVPERAWKNACAFGSTSIADVGSGKDISDDVTLSVEVGVVTDRLVAARVSPNAVSADSYFPLVEAEIASGRAAAWCRLVASTPRRARTVGARSAGRAGSTADAAGAVDGVGSGDDAADSQVAGVTEPAGVGLSPGGCDGVASVPSMDDEQPLAERPLKPESNLQFEPANLEALRRLWAEAPYLFMLTPFNEVLRWCLRTKMDSSGTDAAGLSTLSGVDVLAAVCTQPLPLWRQKLAPEPSAGAIAHGRFQQLVRAGFDRGWVVAFLDEGRAWRDPAETGAGTNKSAHLSSLIDAGAWDVLIPIPGTLPKAPPNKRAATRILGTWFAEHGARWLTLLLGGHVALEDGRASPRRLHLGTGATGPSSLAMIRRDALAVRAHAVAGAPWITGAFRFLTPVRRSDPSLPQVSIRDPKPSKE